MVARRAQTPIHIRSDRAAAQLAVLTRQSGRSQAEVIEDALDRVAQEQGDDPFAHLAPDARALAWRIKARTARIPPGSFPTMKEFDATEYDEFGDPR